MRKNKAFFVICTFAISAFATEAPNYPPDTFVDGLTTLDVLKGDDLSVVRTLNLETFRPLFDFQAPPRPQDSSEPWLGLGLDVTRAKDAEMLAKVLQRYIYEGWFDADRSKGKLNSNGHFRENAVRTWCQTPWLNVTAKGRESIHGLTKEFPLASSPAYRIPEEIEKNAMAYSWGLAFYNRRFCEIYDYLFQGSGADIQKRVHSPDARLKPQDGAVDFKLLFGVMENWQQNMKGQWDGAYIWDAHVSTNRKVDTGTAPVDQSLRKMMKLPHIQMDVGFKDSRVAGTRSQLGNWAMLTFYYDPSYRDNELINDLDIPEPLKHMRPVGLQYGLDVGESHIFPGAKNNHRPAPAWLDLPDSATRLNGPIDSSATSCMGCHSQSGMSFGLNPKSDGKPNFAPWFGFLKNEDYLHFLSPEMGNGATLHFNMQLDGAIKNLIRSNGSF